MAELNRPDRTESDPTPSPEIERPKVQRSTSVDGGPMLTSALRTPNSERVKKRVSFSLPNEAELVSYSTRRRRSASTSPRNRRNHENSRRALSPQTSENNVDNSSRHHRPQRDSRRSNRYLSPSPTNQDYNYGSPTHRRKKELLSSSPPRDDNSSSSVVIPVLSPQQQQKKDGNEGVADITSDLTSGARVVRQPRADKLLFDSSQAKRSVSLDSNPSQSRPSLARRVSKSFLGSFRRDNSHNGVASSV
uniref:Uncharacterized protein n=1 Tax=Aureoumbra lagunensis TaxID=44058 RepID=A0A7S3JYD6_9STRA